MDSKKRLSLMEDDSISVLSNRPPNSPWGRRFSFYRNSTAASSGSSISNASEHSASELTRPSCVSRSLQHNDCATLRFIVWAATERNQCERMTDAQRLVCPLLHCKHRSPTHEAMLQHLIDCKHLPYGEYLCAEHMEVERFDDSRCKKCMGPSSRRRHMMSKALSGAKRFLATLGHTKGKAVAAGSFIQSHGFADDSQSHLHSHSHSHLHRHSHSPSFSIASSPSDHVDDMDSNCVSKSHSSSSHRSRRGYLTSSSHTTTSRSSRNNSNRSSRSNRSNRSNLANPNNATSYCGSGEPAFAPSSNSPLPPRYEEISSAVPSELYSTEIVEIDSTPRADVPNPALPSPSFSPASASLYSSTPTIIPVPTCVLSRPSAPIQPSSINPQDLLFAELESTQLQPTMDWEPQLPSSSSAPTTTAANSASPAYSAMPAPPNCSGGTTPSFSFAQPYFDFHSSNAHFFDSHMPSTGLSRPPLQVTTQDDLLSGPLQDDLPLVKTTDLERNASVKSCTSTASYGSTDSSCSSASDASTSSNITTASSLFSPVSDYSPDCPDLWSTGQGTGLTSATTDFGDLLLHGNAFTADHGGCDGSVLSSTQHQLADVSYALLFSLDDCPTDTADKESGGITVTNEKSPTEATRFDSMNNLELSVAGMAGLDGVASAGGASVAVVPSDPPSDRHLLPTMAVSPEVSDSDPMAITESAWVLLEAHISNSLDKLNDLDLNNSLATRLQGTALKRIVATGIQALRTTMMMAGRAGSENLSPFSTLCLLHLVYAVFGLTYGQEAASRSDGLFIQALGYASKFAPPDRDNYLELVNIIWKPGTMSRDEVSRHIHESCRSLPGDALTLNVSAELDNGVLVSDNPVIATTMTFLDHLEMSVILNPPSLPANLITSELFTLHSYRSKTSRPSVAFTSSVDGVLDSLRQEFFRTDGLPSNLATVSRYASNGNLHSVRHLELELLQAGKASLGCSVVFFDSFVPRTRHLCDTIYADHESASFQRLCYYDKGILLLWALFDEVDGCVRHAIETKADVHDNQAETRMGDDEAVLHLADYCQEYADLFPASTIAMEKISSAGTVAGREHGHGPSPQFGNSSSSSSTSDTTAGYSATVPVDGKDTSDEGEEELDPSMFKCDMCSYRPTGNPKWYVGSLAKHKQTMHSKDVFYKCTVLGCNSVFRNRADNLRQHLKKKHPNIDGAMYSGRGALPQHEYTQIQQAEADESSAKTDGQTVRRPSKRKKMSE